MYLRIKISIYIYIYIHLTFRISTTGHILKHKKDRKVCTCLYTSMPAAWFFSVAVIVTEQDGWLSLATASSPEEDAGEKHIFLCV